MPNDPITTVGLALAAAAAAGAFALAVRRVRRGEASPRAEGAMVAAAASASAAVFAYRGVTAEAPWRPLNSHVDGLALLSMLVALAIGHLHWAGRLRGADVFGLPILAVMLLWGVCASWWTFRPFEPGGLWATVHILAVYIGSAGVAVSGVLGAMYLFVRRQLRRRDNRAGGLRSLGAVASLERVEQWMRRAGALSFVMLTVAVGFGAASMFGEGGTGAAEASGPTGAAGGSAAPAAVAAAWWAKVLGGTAVWLVFAAMVQARWLASLRGRGSAWLALAGLGLMLAVMAVSLRG